MFTFHAVVVYPIKHRLSFFDVQGKVVLSQKDYEYNDKMDLGVLKPGAYVVKVFNGEKVNIEKFIKIN
jgi:hypothetical protein